MTGMSKRRPKNGGIRLLLGANAGGPATLAILLLLVTNCSLVSAQGASPLFGGSTASCTHPEPTCATTYYKISDEANGLATSCAAVDQAADPVVGLDQNECQHECDKMEGCDTINFRWKDPNFNGTSTCYRKQCGDFKTAACTLFSKHKERDVYTKACGAGELWGKHVIGDAFTDLFAGVACPDETNADVAQVLNSCAASAVAPLTTSSSGSLVTTSEGAAPAVEEVSRESVCSFRPSNLSSG